MSVNLTLRVPLHFEQVQLLPCFRDEIALRTNHMVIDGASVMSSANNMHKANIDTIPVEPEFHKDLNKFAV